jgi:sulfite oxidase
MLQKRNSLLKIVTEKPLNAETPSEYNAEKFVTPNELHFIRNHLDIPKINLESYVLVIEPALKNEKFFLSLDDIKTKFPIHTITGLLTRPSHVNFNLIK